MGARYLIWIFFVLGTAPLWSAPITLPCELDSAPTPPLQWKFQCPSGTEPRSKRHTRWCIETSSGQRQGPWARWYSDGTIAERTYFEKGKLNGAYLFHGSGDYRIARFKNGKLNGVVKRWKFKRKTHEVFFENGKPHGPWREYDSFCRPTLEGQYEQGRPVGNWTTWCRDPLTGKKSKRNATLAVLVEYGNLTRVENQLKLPEAQPSYFCRFGESLTALELASNLRSQLFRRAGFPVGPDNQVIHRARIKRPQYRQILQLLKSTKRKLSMEDRAFLDRIKQRNYKKAKQWLDRGANINAEGPYGRNALYFAAKAGDQEGYDQLKKWGARTKLYHQLLLCPIEDPNPVEKQFLGKLLKSCECPPDAQIRTKCKQGQLSRTCEKRMPKGKRRMIGINTVGIGNCVATTPLPESLDYAILYRNGEAEHEWQCTTRAMEGNQKEEEAGARCRIQ